MLWCLNKLRHVILAVLVALWREDDFLDFLESSTQIEGEQNIISIAAPTLSNFSSAMRGVE